MSEALDTRARLLNRIRNPEDTEGRAPVRGPVRTADHGQGRQRGLQDADALTGVT